MPSHSFHVDKKVAYDHTPLHPEAAPDLFCGVQALAASGSTGVKFYHDSTP